MNIKSIINLGIILLVLITIGSVSAVDYNHTDLNDNSFAIGEDNNLNQGNIGDSNNNGSFNDLDNIVNSNKTGVIDLDKNYNPGNSSYLTIKRNNIIINGNDFTIDGKNLTSSGNNPNLYIEGINVTFKNINFKKLDIKTYGRNCTFINCTFTNTTLNLYGSQCNVINSKFTNNINKYGGAMNIIGEKSNIINNTFFNNSAIVGGAIYSYAYSTQFINNTIVNNLADYAGGIFLYGGNQTLINNTIVNNTGRKQIGGVIYSKDVNLINNIIKNNIPEDIVFINDTNLRSIDTFDSFIDDGYYVFCANMDRYGPGSFSLYEIENLTYIENSLDHSNVAQYLKILVYNYYDDLDQEIIWIFTDNDYLHSNNTIVQKVIADYNNGLRLSNSPKKQLNKTHYIQYYYKFYSTTDSLYQNLFGFKKSINQIVYNFTASKISLDPVVIIGNQTRFLIKIKNTGNWKIDNPYIIEHNYDGLIYDSYIDKDKVWIYNNGKWIYNGSLNENETIYLTIIFNTTKLGNFTNFAIIGSNQTDNKTVNNTTTVNNHTNNTKTHNSTKNHNNTKTHNSTNYITKGSLYGTGNPLYLLFNSLIFLSIIPLRRKK
ncbi:MAG: hypothetical protein ACI4VU_00105 [Methanobrevibacter sp.]